MDPLAVQATRTFLELLLPGEQRGLKIYRKNSLSTHKDFAWEEDLTGLLEPESFDLVIGNPPAGNPLEGVGRRPGTSTDSLPQEYRDLQGFFQNLPDTYAFARRQRRHEVAHLERFLTLAKPGGKVAIILPEGVFANSNLRYVREWLVQNFTIRAVIGLPRDTFKSTGTTAKTAILCLERCKPPVGHQVLLAEVGQIELNGRPNSELEAVVAALRERETVPARAL
jgi:type I restriction enzyme M protein